MFTTIISPSDLQQLLDERNVVIVDCRFDLSDPAKGKAAYLESHIPHAVYAHLDDDLSGMPFTDYGRHPLPSPDQLATIFGRLGIKPETQVIAYDDVSGVFAGRLWWMLRYMAHDRVAVLDGGWKAWQQAALPTRSGEERNRRTRFEGEPNTTRLVLADEVMDQSLLIDSRDEERYLGLMAGPDPKAGHIRGAKHRHFAQNWDENGFLLPQPELRKQYAQMLGDTNPSEATYYCGSGVSACLNILAQLHAGFDEPKLYVGSWSEWSQDERPFAQG